MESVNNRVWNSNYMSRRIEKVNELLIQEVGKSIKKVIDDPGFGFVTVVGADASPDLKNAKIFVSVLGGSPGKSLKILKKNIFEIQKLLNKDLQMRYVPRISFHLDKTAEDADRMERLFDEIDREENKE